MSEVALTIHPAGHSGAGRIRRIAAKHGTPLLIVREAEIIRNYRLLEQMLPEVRIYYAMKANPDRQVLTTIIALGGSIEVASRQELETCCNLHLNVGRILYSHPIKPPGDIKRARTVGVDTFVCDNRAEVRKVAGLAPGARILVRVKVTNPFCVVNLSEKFGCDVDQVEPLMLEARSLGLVPKGIAFHVGSQTRSPIPFVETLQIVRGLCNRLLAAGIELDVLDIGGGFPLSVRESAISIEAFCAPVANTIANLFGSFAVCCEPGRFLVGGSATLVTSVIGKAVRDNVPWYYLDDGVYGGFSGRLFDKADYPLYTDRAGKRAACVVAGPTCDSIDIIFTDRSLPDLQVGDLLWATNIGAYSVATATCFNGFGPIKTVFIPKDDDEL